MKISISPSAARVKIGIEKYCVINGILVEMFEINLEDLFFNYSS